MIWILIAVALIGIIECFALLKLWEKYKENICINKKNNCYLTLLKLWMMKRNQGKSIGEYLKSHDVDSVAIYGNGEIGKILYKELQAESYCIDYVIDRMEASEEYMVLKLSDSLPQTGAIIVTPYLEYDSIVDQLSKVVKYEIISLEDIIFDY